MFNKKMILMLVLLTAMVVGAAQAGDFKVYGKLHTSVDLTNNGDDSQLVLSSNTSRFGIKGSSELNENFTFIWQFEQKLNMAQKGSETLANRNSFVGLNGNWGTALVGIHDTPFKTLGRKSTFFFDEIGDFRTVTMGWDRRLQDVIVYASPNFSGFGFTAAYQFDQDIAAAENARTAFSINAMYKKDGFLIGAALESLSKGYADSDITAGEEKSQMGIRASIKKMWDGSGLSFMYQTLSDRMGYDGVSGTTMGFEGKWQFAPKFGLKAGYYWANPYTDAEDDSATEIDESAVNYQQLAIGVDHNFSKTVGFYLQYATVMNGDYSQHELAGPWHGNTVYAAEMGGTPNAFSLGTWFKF